MHRVNIIGSISNLDSRSISLSRLSIYLPDRGRR